MIEREIRTGERERFFESFNRLHGGAYASLRIGKDDQVVDEPFLGLSSDGDDVVVHVESRKKRVHHGLRIPHVESVRLQQTDEGADAAVQMQSPGGLRTTLRFRSPMLPELLEPDVE
jgi:hypothetical protein